MNGRRVTFVLEKDLEGRLRKLQAKKIQKTNEEISFSNILNDALKRYLKSNLRY